MLKPVLQRAAEDLDHFRQLALDDSLLKTVGQVLEEAERVDRAQIDLHFAVGTDLPAERLERELTLALDVRVGLGVGAGEHQGAHAGRVTHRQFLGDHASHRHPTTDCARPERREQARRVSAIWWIE